MKIRTTGGDVRRYRIPGVWNHEKLMESSYRVPPFKELCFQILRYYIILLLLKGLQCIAK